MTHLHEHAAVRAARAEVQRVAAELARYESKLAELLDNAPKADAVIGLARRILGGAPPADPLDDLAHVVAGVDALRRALAEARLAAERAEIEAQREFRDAHAERIAELDRELLAALDALARANEARRTLNLAAEAAGFDPLVSNGFDPEAVVAIAAGIRADADLERALAAARPGETRRVRLLIARGEQSPGDVIDLPAEQAIRLVHERRAETMPGSTPLLARVRAALLGGEPMLE